MRNTAAPYKVHHREHGTGKYPQQTEVIYEPISVIGAAQYLLPGWERKRKLMAVVCQHEAEQHHRKYKDQMPIFVQRTGLPPIQKEKRIKCKGWDQQHRDIVRIPQSPQHLRRLGKVIADQADIQPEQHQSGSAQQAAAGLCVQDTPPDRYRPEKDQNIIQHRAPKAGIRHIKRPHQDSAENHPCNRSG